MVANGSGTHSEGEWPDGPPSPFDVASYVYLTAQELEPMAGAAGLGDVAAALGRTRDLAAAALQRLGEAR